MHRFTRYALVVSTALFFVGCTEHKTLQEAEPVSSVAFRAFVDDYFKQLFDYQPSNGTSAGFHEYDDKLEDFSAVTFKNRITALKSLQTRLDALRREKLTAEESMDAQILDGQIKSELQDLQIIETWKRNPMNYVGLPGTSVDLLMKRDFAPAAERLRSLIARLRKIEPLLKSMQDNMVTPPKEFTDLAIQISGGSIGFFRDSVSEWAKQAAGSDSALWKDFELADKSAVAAFENATRYLKGDLLPKSKGGYAIGAQNYSNKLLYDEMVDIPLDRLLQIGEANLDKDYKDFVETAHKIDAGKTPAQVMKLISLDHPTEATLIPAAKETLETIRQYIIDHKIITIPGDTRPIVTETPPYARSGTFASMDSPGAYEKKAKEAFYYVTPVEKDWTPEQKEQHLRAYNRPVLNDISVHEVYPGHFVQFLYVREFPTKTRKLVSVGSNVEGWAHYGEQMMIEEGFGGGDPKMRLAQLSEALLRDCRYVVGIKLHTQNMTVEDGAKVFQTKGFQEPKNAYEEARRGAWNPTYLYYTLGKLQIYKLREDYKRAKGTAFNLETFHNEFVKQGGIPVKLIREILLPGDKGPTL
jgi:uncharacterized protein (DUF885 family)